MFSFFKEFPDELVLKIVSKMNSLERAQFALTCKQFNTAKLKLAKIDSDLHSAIINITFSTDVHKIEDLAKKIASYIEMGANVNMISPITRLPLLCFLGTEGCANALGAYYAAEILIKYGANINPPMATPLFLAALYGNAKIAKLFIDHGANGLIDNQKYGDVERYPYLYHSIITNQNWQDAFQEEINKGTKYLLFRSFSKTDS